MEAVWKTPRLMPRLTVTDDQQHQPTKNDAFEADTNASSDEDGDIRGVSINDIVEENRVLRKELFLLCEKLMELEQQGRVEDETDGDVATEEANKSDLQHQYNDLKHELYNLRLLNHELGRRALYLEEDRKHKENELLQLNVELLHLTPFKSQALDMKKSLDVLQSETNQLKMLLASVSNDREREKVLRTSLEDQIKIFETQIQVEKEENVKLQTQLTVNESIHHEASLQLLQQRRDIATHQIENEQLRLKLQAMTAELKHSHRRSESQAKEIARLKTVSDAASTTPPLALPPILVAESGDLQVKYDSGAVIPSVSKSKLQPKATQATRSVQRIESMEMIEDCTCGDFSFLRR